MLVLWRVVRHVGGSKLETNCLQNSIASVKLVFFLLGRVTSCRISPWKAWTHKWQNHNLTYWENKKHTEKFHLTCETHRSEIAHHKAWVNLWFWKHGHPLPTWSKMKHGMQTRESTDWHRKCKFHNKNKFEYDSTLTYNWITIDYTVIVSSNKETII